LSSTTSLHFQGCEIFAPISFSSSTVFVSGYRTRLFSPKNQRGRGFFALGYGLLLLLQLLLVVSGSSGSTAAKVAARSSRSRP